ncbi:MAG TPA: hypothetical protein VM120_10615 [Bryobacteraceae bacterium]|nr:hypothetical protein [Bryobacteraceae bacterium]
MTISIRLSGLRRIVAGATRWACFCAGIVLAFATVPTGTPAVVDNISPDGVATPNSITSAAKPGSLARLTIAVTATPGRVELLIGNDKVRITRRQIRNGAHELTVRVPDNTGEGCYVPLHVTIGGGLLPDSVAIAVSNSGVCRFPAYQPSSAWLSKKTGIAARIHSTEWSLDNGSAASTVDIVSAFFDGDAATLQPGPMLRFPPPGHCASQLRSYVRGTPTIDILLPLMFPDVSGIELDSGEFLNLDDGRYQIRIPRVVGRSGLFWKTAASSKEEFQPLNTSGDLYLRGSGGRDVNPFVAILPLPPSFDWLNRPASPILNIRRDTPVTWKAASPGHVLVAAIAVDPVAARFSYCLCVAPPAAKRLDLPWRVLSGLVASTADGREAAGALYLIHIPETIRRFPTQQLETTAGLSLRVLTAKVVFRR